MAQNKSTGGGKKPGKKLTPAQLQQKRKEQQKKSNLITWLIVIIGVLIIILFFLLMTMTNNSSSSTPSDRTTTASMPAVDGMTCDSMEGAVIHEHAHLTILNNGENVTVPANIGIYNPPNTCFYWLHTHDDTGEIHMESPSVRSFTLGNFFDVWKQPLSTTQVLGFSDKGQPVKAYVDGKPYTGDPRNIQLKAHTLVVLEVGPKFVPPPNTYTFPDGD